MTILWQVKCKAGSLENILRKAEEKRVNMRIYSRDHVGVSLDETVTDSDLEDLLYCFGSNTALVG